MSRYFHIIQSFAVDYRPAFGAVCSDTLTWFYIWMKWQKIYLKYYKMYDHCIKLHLHDNFQHQVLCTFWEKRVVTCHRLNQPITLLAHFEQIETSTTVKRSKNDYVFIRYKSANKNNLGRSIKCKARLQQHTLFCRYNMQTYNICQTNAQPAYSSAWNQWFIK